MKQFWTRNCHPVDGSSSEDPHLSSVWRIFCTRLSVQSSQWWASAGLFAVIFIVIIFYLNNSTTILLYLGSLWERSNFQQSNFVAFVLGICWRWLCQGSDHGLGVSCYLSSTGRQTKWRWYLFLLVHHTWGCVYTRGLKFQMSVSNLNNKYHNSAPTHFGSMLSKLIPVIGECGKKPHKHLCSHINPEQLEWKLTNFCYQL